MSASVSCRCGERLTADTAELLLPLLQEHVDAHAAERGLPRHRLTLDQVRARLDRPDLTGDA